LLAVQIVTGVFTYAPALRTLAPRLVRELLTRNDFIKQSFERWQSYYEAKFAAVLATRRPNFDVTASELAETVVSVLEGAFILARSFKEPDLITRQSRLLRDYLTLLFEEKLATALA